MPAWWGGYRFPTPAPLPGPCSTSGATTTSSPQSSNSMRTTAGPWSRWPRILAEDLCPLVEPLGALLAPGPAADPAAVARSAARALIETGDDRDGLAHWLQPHQRPAVRRL